MCKGEGEFCERLVKRIAVVSVVCLRMRVSSAARFRCSQVSFGCSHGIIDLLLDWLDLSQRFSMLHGSFHSMNLSGG